MFNFEKKAKTSNVLESWFEISSVSDRNNMENILTNQKGFSFTDGGILFPTGHLTLKGGNYA